MGRRITAGIVVIAGTAVALLAGPRGPVGGFWRPIAVEQQPAAWSLAGLLTASVVEAIGFGLALAALAVGRPLFGRLTTGPARATAARVAAAWVLGSWWPHSALHMHYGPRPSVLAGLELAFHAGSIVATAVLLWAVLTGGADRRAMAG
jgi:hypothetical protein